MIISQQLSPSIYYKDTTKKTHIILHHTAGTNSASALQTWITIAKKNPAIGAHFLIDRNGEVTQCIPLDKWSYSLGLAGYTYRSAWEKQAVTIEIVSAGKIDVDGKTWWGGKVNASEVELLAESFRGSKYYHSYTEAQMIALEKLLSFISEQTGIQLKTGELTTFFDYQAPTLKKKKPENYTAEKTIFTHVNFRTEGDKQDCYPSVKLKNLLRKFEKKKMILQVPM